MRKTIVALLSVGVVGALAIAFVSCGGTGGGLGDVATGEQFVSSSCSPDTDCLSLVVSPSSLPADGSSVAGFRATLVDGSGAPLDGIEICFSMEVSGVATIIEPSGGCGITDVNGRVSGQLRAGTQTGSYALIAEAPPAFQLEARRTIRFGAACSLDLTPDSDELSEGDSIFLRACISCSDGTVDEDVTVTFSSPGTTRASRSPGTATTGSDGCALSTLTATQNTAVDGNVTVTITATSSDGDDTSTFLILDDDSACTTNADCPSTSQFCGTGGACGDAAGVCLPKLGSGECCTTGSMCTDGTCSGSPGTC